MHDMIRCTFVGFVGQAAICSTGLKSSAPILSQLGHTVPDALGRSILRQPNATKHNLIQTYGIEDGRETSPPHYPRH